MLETLNLAIERYNAGDFLEALRFASAVPEAVRAEPAVTAMLATVGAGAIAAALAAEAHGETMDAVLEQATAIVSRQVAVVTWSQVTAERLNRADHVVALHAACFALDADPSDLTARALFAECAARVDAPDVAASVAHTLLARTTNAPMAERLRALMIDARDSRLDTDQASPEAIAWHNEGDAWRGAAPARAIFSKVMAASGALPVWQGVFDIGLMMAARGQADLALALFDRVAATIRRSGIAEHAHDQLLTKLGRFGEKYERRMRVMSQKVMALVPPADPAAVADWSLDATRPDALAGSLAALRTHGFVLVVGAIDSAAIAEVAAAVFAETPERRFVDPNRDIPAPARERLLAPLLRQVLDALQLVGPDAATSHGRQVFPGPEADQDSLTIAYHQDSLAFYQPLLNVWIPLDPCGDDAPGLALLSDRTRHILPGRRDAQKPSDSEAVDFEVVADLIRENGEIVPKMQPGDALLFLGTVPHRTFLSAAMTKPRRSLELRFVPADWLMTPMSAA